MDILSSMKRALLARVVTMGFGIGILSAGAFAQTLLVANQGDSTLGFIDLKSGKQVAALAEGVPNMHGHEVTASPDGKTAYMPIYGNVGVGQPGLNGTEMLLVDVPTRSSSTPTSSSSSRSRSCPSSPPTFSIRRWTPSRLLSTPSA